MSKQRILCRRCAHPIADVHRRRLFGRRVQPTIHGEIIRADNASATVRCKACGLLERVTML
jgi:uncharacterized Zn finger protein